jgi:hypothetical protein
VRSSAHHSQSFSFNSLHRYVALVETYIERRLTEAFPGFEMDAFMQQLQQHEQEMDGSDVLEVLLSFGDFSTFKDIMLSYKTEMEGSMQQCHVDVRSSVLHLPQVISLTLVSRSLSCAAFFTCSSPLTPARSCLHLLNSLLQMGLGGGMDESFEDPGTFDDDDEEELLDDGQELDAAPAPDLSGLLSVSPLVRFSHMSRVCHSDSCHVTEPTRQGQGRSAVPGAWHYGSSLVVAPFNGQLLHAVTTVLLCITV